jgi:hypothetical protein
MLDNRARHITLKTTMRNSFAPKSKLNKPKTTAKQTLREWASFFESLYRKGMRAVSLVQQAL